MSNKVFDCIILGGGPAGLSSALYCSRANLNCAIVDNSALGGTPINYCEIENYLGFNKIRGYELCEKFEQHVDCFDVFRSCGRYDHQSGVPCAGSGGGTLPFCRNKPSDRIRRNRI